MASYPENIELGIRRQTTASSESSFHSAEAESSINDTEPKAAKLARIFKQKPSKRIFHLFLTFVATVVAVALSVGLAYAYVVQVVSYQVPLQSNSSRKISLITSFLSADPEAGVLVADWYPLAPSCDDPEAIVNFYFDPNLLAPSDGGNGSTPSDQPPSQPTFQFNTTSRCDPGIRDSFATFRTTSKMIATLVNRVLDHSLQSYPFDSYHVQFSLYAELNSTNEPVGIIVERPVGTIVNFNVELDPVNSVNQEDGLLISLKVTRSPAVKVLAVTVVIANWIVTVAFLYITAACLVWTEEEVVANLFAVPIGAVFAFTSVRANLPGAPNGFGAFIDFVGILPNLTIMTLCSAVLLILVLFRRVFRRNHTGIKEHCKRCCCCKDVEANGIKEE